MYRAVTVLASLAALATPGRAAPTVTVKARTAVELEPVRRVPGGIEVSGALIDTSQRAPVPWATLQLSLDGAETVAQSRDDGRFTATFPVTDGVHTLRVRFPGDRSYAPATAALEAFDVTKDRVALTVRTSREVSIGREPARLAVAARGETGPVDVEVGLWIADEAGRERSLGTVATLDGRAELSLAPEQLGPPGRKRVVARFSGNDAYDVATAETQLVVTTATELSVAFERTTLRFEDRLRARGRLTDAHGDPIDGVTVSLVAGTRRVADALTADDGRFELGIEASELGEGQLSAQARFDAAEAWRESSRSPPVAIEIRPPQPVPMGYTLAAFAATSLAVMAFALLRTRPWESLIARLRWTGNVSGELAADAAADTPGDARRERDAVEPGVQPARPGIVQSLRRAQEHGFSGVVRDALSGRRLAGVVVRIGLADGPRELHTDADGRFDFGELPAGTWACSASLATFCTEQFPVELPHRGELRGARIDLIEVRERIFRMYREAAEPLLPPQASWGVWTPRQIVDHVRAGRPAPALAELTEYIEHAYFSRRKPIEENLADAATRVRAAVSERQRGPL